MALTPQSVREKQFTPTRFKTGYDEDEVDAFLDEVETELARLLEENAGLRRALETQASAPAAPADLGTARVEPRPAAVAAPAPPRREEVDVSRPGSAGQAELEEMLRRTLLLAQRTADEAVAEARAEAERMVNAAHADAEATLSAARGAAEEQARASLERQARDLAQHEAERQRLEVEVTALQAFERDYRTRLRAYLEMQLRELETTPPVEVPGGRVEVAPSRVPRPAEPPQGD